MRKLILCATMLVAMTCQLFAQNTDISSMTKEDIMKLSYDELLEMPFEDVMKLADIMGVSMDDLFAMIMNKSVSSASKKAEDSFKSPLASTVITKAEIRSYGITSIEEALRLIPGVIVQERTNGMYDVHIRGLNNIPDNQMMLYTENANTLLMIDGRIAHEYATGCVDFSVLPIGVEDIERIEVVRGANAALYGPNALMGVINIITEKTTENSKELQGSLTMGTHENYIGDVAYRKNFGKKLGVGITANLQYRRRNTNQLYVYPTQGLMYSKLNDQERAYVEMQGGLDQQTLGAFLYGAYRDEEGNVKYDPSRVKLIDASQGGYYKTTDIENLKQLFTFGAIAGEVPDELKATIYEMQKAKGAEYLQAVYGETEASEKTVAMFLQGLAGSLPYGLYDAMEKQLDVADMFDDPGMSRKTYGFNSYVSYRPLEDVTFDLSFGYQQSRANTLPVGELPFTLAERVSQTGYANLNANIKDLSLNVNYMGGLKDFMKGAPGFKIFTHNIQASAEYDIKVGDILNVVPGVSYNYVNFKDYIPDYKNPSDPNDFSWEYHDHDYKSPNGRHLSGYFDGGTAELKDFAPSLRADFHVGGFRAIAAARFDKTNIPDKWNPSYQIGANYLINDNNIIRASYSTAMRSANMVNSNTLYSWHRDGMMPPDTVYFQADKNAPLAKTSNIELGYRWRPTEKILIDAEAYYSISKDFGALKANQSSVILPSTYMMGFMTDTSNLGALNNIQEGRIDESVLGVLGKFMGISSVSTNIKYSKLPYTVKQMGIGVNVDWIISPKLIAKVNANVQQTKIDNYYAYNQNAEVLGQLGQVFGMITRIPDWIYNIQYDAIETLIKDGTYPDDPDFNFMADPADFMAYLERYIGKYLPNAIMTNVNNIDAVRAEYNSLDEAGKAAMLDDLRHSNDPQKYASYYALEYGMYSENGIFHFGDSKPYEIPTENGVKHKATPSVYGMVGLIYKPTPKIDIAAYGNYIGKRTYATKYSTEKLDDRFTVSMKFGYKPADGIEVYLNAHNMFNNKEQEFPYGDKIGGIYSVGVSFGF